MILGPAMDLMRNPKAGRGWESFGPDPWLAGEAAYETVVGIQSTGVQACAKHFMANIQEHFRFQYTAEIDDRTVHELYLWPYLRSFEANVSSVMCAYNQVNGTYSCQNPALLGNDGLLYSNGFQGFTISDWGATHPSTSQTANAGLDMEQPGDFILIGGGVYGTNLELAVTLGTVKEERLDEMATRILASWYRLGQDQDFPKPNFNTHTPDPSGPSVRTADTLSLVREIAGASTVLLKNSNKTLPLKAGSIKTMAVIGLDAQTPDPDCMLDECDTGVVTVGYGSGSNLLDFVVSPIVSLTSFAGQNGISLTSSLEQDQDKAKTAAVGKDVALVFVNAFSGENPLIGTINGTFGDRNDMDLFFKGGSLVEAVASVNNNTVVVIHSPGPVLTGPWSDFANVTAIIYAGMPGEQAGPAIVDVLTGSVNPSGRLPFTIAMAEADYPAPILYDSLALNPTIDFSEQLNLDYRHFDANNITPRYEFGFGLSYTTFVYSGLSVNAGGDGATVSFTVKNNGTVSGTEIPQMYLGFPASAGEPPKVLRGFDEVQLPAGQSKTVQMSLSARDISVWDTPSQSWKRPSGSFDVFVGASSRNIRLTGNF